MTSNEHNTLLDKDRTLVIVTCYRDLDQLSILIKSINLYLEPSKILIILNEEDNFFIWKNWYLLNTISDNHDVKIVLRRDLLPSSIHKGIETYKNNWIIQQILKILAAELVTTEQYILLDSKNFFIKQISLNKIKQSEPAKLPDPFYQNLLWISAVVSKLSRPLNELIHYRGALMLSQAATPYVLETEHVKELLKYFGGSVQFVNWYIRIADNVLELNNDILPNVLISEFYLYELFSLLELTSEWDTTVPTNNMTFWDTDNLSKAEIDNCFDNIPEYMYVSGIHRFCLQKASPDLIDHIYYRAGLLNNAALAQTEERLISNQDVGGSIPSSSTNKFHR